MSKLTDLFSSHKGKIYIYLATETIGKQFLQDAENQGFTFGDGEKPTNRHPSDIIGISKNHTINYVSTAGRIAIQSKDKSIAMIDYRNMI